MVVPGGLARETTEAPRRRELAVATFNVENLDPATAWPSTCGSPTSSSTTSRRRISSRSRRFRTTTARPTPRSRIHPSRSPPSPRPFRPPAGRSGPTGGRSIPSTTRTAASRAGTSGSRSCSGPTAASSSSTGRAERRRPRRRCWGVEGRRGFRPARAGSSQDAAFTNSRKPLAGEFRYRGETLFVVANHFNSKGGDQPLFGRFQPPTRSSEVQRHAQAAIVERLRRRSSGVTSRERDRARRLERLPGVLRDARHRQGRPRKLDRDAARAGALRRLRRQPAGTRPHPRGRDDGRPTPQHRVRRRARELRVRRPGRPTTIRRSRFSPGAATATRS